VKRFDARQARGFVDKAKAFPTTPQAQQQQQKRSIHVLHKAVNSICYRQADKFDDAFLEAFYAANLSLDYVLLGEGEPFLPKGWRG